MDEPLTRITEHDDPASFVGRTVTFHERRYRITEIIAEGMEKIVFALADVVDGSHERVLKVYRQRMDAAFLAQREHAYRILREHGVPTTDVEFHHIGDWLVEFERRYAGALHLGAEAAWARRDPAYEDCRQAARRLDAGDHDGAWRIVERGLDSHPLQPDLLFLGVLARCGQGETVEAAGLVSQWLSTGDDEDHLVRMVLVLLESGAPRLARALYHEGIPLVHNGLKAHRLRCDLESGNFGDLAAARAAREQYAAAGAAPGDLAEVDDKLGELARLTGALDRFGDPGGQAALAFAEQAIVDWPYHAQLNRLLGFARYRAGQHAECIGPLTIASTYEQRDADVAVTLGLAHLRSGEADKAAEWWGFWARLLTDGTRRLLAEIAVPGPGRIEVEAPEEAYVLLRRDMAIAVVGLVRSSLPGLRDGGVPRGACRELSRELDELESLLRDIPDLGARIDDE